VRAGKSARRRRTRLWFAFYTVALVAIVVVSVWMRQWSVAATTLAVAVLFALFTRHVWRRR
jgi:Flp pilus assembly protein TadB